MNKDFFEKLEEQAQTINTKIVFPEGDDPEVLKAAEILLEKKIARPILLGDQEIVQSAASANNINIDEIPIIKPETSPDFEKYAALYAETRGSVSDRVAQRLMKKPMFFGAMMVSAGDAGGMVGGAASPTTSLLQAAGLCIGYSEGTICPSSIMLMIMPPGDGPAAGKILAFADPAVNIAPTPEELASIAIQSGISFKRFTGLEPLVAFLSFSSKGSAAHPLVDNVVKAVSLAREMGADFPIDGELQADAAIVPRVAEKKVRDSAVAGCANVLVFPDLNSANIAYKLTQHLAGAQAIGPILQGFKKPVNDLSRGCTAGDIIKVAILTAVQCGS